MLISHRKHPPLTDKGSIYQKSIRMLQILIDLTGEKTIVSNNWPFMRNTNKTMKKNFVKRKGLSRLHSERQCSKGTGKTKSCLISRSMNSANNHFSDRIS